MATQTVSKALKELWQIGFFIEYRSVQDIKEKLGKSGSNPTDNALRKGLKRANYLTGRGSRTGLRYIQKFSSQVADFDKDFLPKELIRALGNDFKNEIDDLYLCYGRSGTCTAFLLRKLLEKLIYIAFSKNKYEEKLRDTNRELIGLKAMLHLCETCKIDDRPFLLPKTAKGIEGIKFLGDTSAHNPLVNVSMETIVPVMPFIVIAYSELVKKL